MIDSPSHHWTSASEPHAIRRKIILKKHGSEIRKLCGNNPWTALPVTVACILQTAAAAAMGVYNVPWWGVFLLSWAIGSIGAGNLMAAHHEISHYLVFKKPLWNRALMIAANLPLAAPLGSMFRNYHIDHHNEMGVDKVDTGLWTSQEHWWVRGNAAVKTFFLLIFPIPFFFRPFFMKIVKPLDLSDLLSWIFVPAFDVAICYYGGYSLKPLAFLLLGTYHGVGLHPIAGHCISEHVDLHGSGQETHSCYDDLLNPLLYNFGYHVEHHDFPMIPWNRLPKLRVIAPEFYETVPYYTSWTYVMWKFITDPSVGKNGIMTKRVLRTGEGKAAVDTKPFTPAEEMPLLRNLKATTD